MAFVKSTDATIGTVPRPLGPSQKTNYARVQRIIYNLTRLYGESLQYYAPLNTGDPDVTSGVQTVTTTWYTVTGVTWTATEKEKAFALSKFTSPSARVGGHYAETDMHMLVSANQFGWSFRPRQEDYVRVGTQRYDVMSYDTFGPRAAYVLHLRVSNNNSGPAVHRRVVQHILDVTHTVGGEL